jgi:hypothetical protein
MNILFMQKLFNSVAPVLFLVFNRPAETKQVFQAIREARPRRLYIAADGPRPNRSGELALCDEVRRIATAIDWECEVKTLFRSENIGCKYAVSSAIDWFFSHEEAGIILEDDTLPSKSFFAYCSELLVKFRDDTRVMKVSGFNVLSGQYDYPYDYFFSNFSFAWGWATWRRAWRLNDLELQHWNLVKNLKFDEFYPFNKERNLCFEQALGSLDTWDYQWDFTMASQGGLQIIPRVSLVQNIGFNEHATHTTRDESKRGQVMASDLEWPLRSFPNIILPNRDYEAILFKKLKRDRLKEVFRMLATKLLYFVSGRRFR